MPGGPERARNDRPLSFVQAGTFAAVSACCAKTAAQPIERAKLIITNYADYSGKVCESCLVCANFQIFWEVFWYLKYVPFEGRVRALPELTNKPPFEQVFGTILSSAVCKPIGFKQHFICFMYYRHAMGASAHLLATVLPILRTSGTTSPCRAAQSGACMRCL